MTRPAKQASALPVFDLARFRQLAAAGDAAALPILRSLLSGIEQGGALATSPAGNPTDTRRICKGLADGIHDLFASPTLELAPEDCDWLARNDQHLAAVLRLARRSNPRRVARRVKDALKAPHAGPGLGKLLAVSGIASGAACDWRDMLARAPETALPFFIANFTHRALFDSEAERWRDSLFALAPLLAGLALRPSAMPVLSAAWMLCTYGTAPDRHDLKPPLNALVAGMLRRQGIDAAPLAHPRARETRPTLVVVSEALFAEHAIFRTYAHFLRQLRRRFRLVLVSLEDYFDAAAKALFDEVIAPPWPPGVVWSSAVIRGLVDRIGALGPAVIYYPAVGLSPFTVALANLRLAPVQIAGVGHPATTLAPEIDYMVMGREYFGGAERFSEQVMLLRSGGALFQPHAGQRLPEPSVRDRPEVLRVAIPAAPMKINASFLDLLGRVGKASGRGVEFRFFPNITGLRHLDCRRQIEERLPGARVYQRLGYDDYMAALADCDVRFGTYPFGGANTGVDGFLAGLPTLVFEGLEPSSRTDSRLSRLFGLPDWLIARDERQYEAAATRLLAADGERAGLARAIVGAGPETILFRKEQELYPTDFADCVWWLYENHERVKASSKRAWTFEDRKALSAN